MARNSDADDDGDDAGNGDEEYPKASAHTDF